jgi:cytochrome c
VQDTVKNCQERYVMKKALTIILACLFIAGIITQAVAAGTKAEAEAMVKKAIAYYKANGKDAAFAEISNNKGKFVKEDLYVTVYDMNGKCVAHGANSKMVGKDLIEMRDPDGVYFVKERVKLANTAGKGWQDYKFTNPVTKKVEPKTMYIEKFDNYIFSCGVYK